MYLPLSSSWLIGYMNQVLNEYLDEFIISSIVDLGSETMRYSLSIANGLNVFVSSLDIPELLFLIRLV